MEYLPPVVEEEQGRQDVGAHLREQGVVEQGAEHGRANDDEHDGGHEPPDAAQPEVRQVDLAGIVVLDEQQAGYKVTRQHEEDGDAQQAAGRPGHAHMVGDDGEHGESPQAVERRYIARLRA